MTLDQAAGRVQRQVLHDVALIAVLALGIRLTFLLLTANTYDYDEFVILLLGRDFAHGAWPYHNFMFFHPPGILVMFRFLEPVTHLWWPLGRMLMSLLDAASAVLVFRIGSIVFGRRAGLVAAIIYALNPLALVSAVRVGQDPVITFLGVLGLYFLVRSSNRGFAVLAGTCLAVAVWVKYPALYFLPAYVLLAPRRILWVLGSAALGSALLLVPFHSDLHALYDQTITFQRTRWSMPLDQRLGTTAIFWLAVNPLALVAMVRKPQPPWLVVSFVLGGLFAFTSQVYYHYFVAVVPFAALLGGAWLAERSRRSSATPAPYSQKLAQPARQQIKVWSVRATLSTAALAVAIVAGTAAVLNLGGSSPLYVTAAHFDAIAPTISVLKQRTNSSQPILADRYEFAYLANRPALAHYFWNVGPLVDAGYLQKRVGAAGAAVLSYGASSGYPPGFEEYLNRRYPSVQTPANTIWLVHPVSARNTMHSG